MREGRSRPRCAKAKITLAIVMPCDQRGGEKDAVGDQQPDQY
jgi:hypothetical protein